MRRDAKLVIERSREAWISARGKKRVRACLAPGARMRGCGAGDGPDTGGPRIRRCGSGAGGVRCGIAGGDGVTVFGFRCGIAGACAECDVCWTRERE